MFRRTLACALILTLSWTGWAWAAGPAFAQEPPKQLSYEETMARLDRFMELIEELRSHVDRSQFDLDALLDKLDYDADGIIKFVNEEIYFEQYPGLLRSAHGTLMSRAGNSLDQSVLLARLLKDAGYEARVARGKLPREEAELLIAEIPKPRTSVGIFVDGSAAEQIFAQLTSLAGIPETAAKIELEDLTRHGLDEATSLHAAARQEADSIQRKLEIVGGQLDRRESLQEIQQEARDYFWVLYRPDTSAWRDIHPAFGSTGHTPEVDADESYSDGIPEALQHRVRLQVFLERSIGQSVEKVPLSGPWERPAANLIEAPLVYNNTPVRPPGAVDSLQGLFSDSDVFVPTLNGVAASDLAFDVVGNTIPMMAVQDAASELFRNMSDKTDQASSAIANLGAASETGKTSARELRALWVNLDLTAPDGRKRSYRQDIWPRRGMRCGGSEIGPECSKTDRISAIRRTLASQISLAVATGSFPATYVLDKVLERIIDNRTLLQLQLDPQRASDLEEWSHLEGVDTNWLGYLPLFDAFDHSRSQARIYRGVPSLVAFRQAINDQGQLSLSLDVMTNLKRAIKSTATGPALAQSELIAEGVWETLMENLFLANSQETALNRALPISRSGATLEEVAVVHDISGISSLNLSDEARHSLERDLTQGYSVILPKESDFVSEQQVEWFRVDPRTGETLGMAVDGRGGALEYLGKLLVGIVLVAPIYVAGCLLLGGELSFCVLAVGKTAAVIGVGAVAVALSVFGAITFTPSEAY